MTSLDAVVVAADGVGAFDLDLDHAGVVEKAEDVPDQYVADHAQVILGIEVAVGAGGFNEESNPLSMHQVGLVDREEGRLEALFEICDHDLIVKRRLVSGDRPDRDLVGPAPSVHRSDLVELTDRGRRHPGIGTVEDQGYPSPDPGRGRPREHLFPFAIKRRQLHLAHRITRRGGADLVHAMDSLELRRTTAVTERHPTESCRQIRSRSGGSQTHETEERQRDDQTIDHQPPPAGQDVFNNGNGFGPSQGRGLVPTTVEADGGPRLQLLAAPFADDPV